MKIDSARQLRLVVIETDIGRFRVSQNAQGANHEILKWDDDLWDYHPRGMEKISTADKFALITTADRILEKNK